MYRGVVNRKQWQDGLTIDCSIHFIEVTGLTVLQQWVTTQSIYTHRTHILTVVLTSWPRPPPLFFRLHWIVAVSDPMGLEWGLRHLGPNQSFRTNAGKDEGHGPAPCTMWSGGLPGAVQCSSTVVLPLIHMLKRFSHPETGLIVRTMVWLCLLGDRLVRNYWKLKVRIVKLNT